MAEKISMMSVKLSKATGPFVIALDVGSTASRGGLYDATGRPVRGSRQRIAHEFTTAGDGTSTIDADQVVAECREIIGEIVWFAQDKGIEDQIAGVAMDSFASSLILVGKNGHALTPCITYADSRSRDHVHKLGELIDESEYHARTGVRLHTSYHPARLMWLRSEHPEIFGDARSVMTIGEYVYLRLAGIRGLATSVAAWSGIIDVRTGALDLPILRAAGIDPELFSPIVDPDKPGRSPSTEWPDLKGVDWFHAIPDGWPSSVGAGAVDSSTVAVAAATSGAARMLLDECPADIPSGLWCYRLSHDRWIVGGALNDVGRAVAWLEATVAPPDAKVADVLAGPPLAHAPSVLPFFSGERATGWARDARATFHGVTTATGPQELWRGVFEGLALSYRRVWDQLITVGAHPERVIASGRVSLEHPSWLQTLADALEVPVVPLAMKRATLRGTALIALDVLAPEVERAPSLFDEAWLPVEKHLPHYRQAMRDFDMLYDVLVAE